MFVWLNDIIDKALLAVFVALMLFGSYIIADIWYLRTVASGNQFMVNRPSVEDADAYANLGDECIGWVTIEGTKVDYPIMQAEDNMKYLNTAPDGSYSLAGSIFLDCKNAPDFSDPYSLVYGHHMSSGFMFGALDDFADEMFFNEHLDATLTYEGEMHEASVLGFMTTDAHEHVIFSPKDYDGQLELMKARASHLNEDVLDGFSGRLVALSTCKDPGTTERTVVFLGLE